MFSSPLTLEIKTMFSFMIITLKLVLIGSVLLTDEHLHLPPKPEGFGSAQDGKDLSRSGGFKPHGTKYPIQQGCSNLVRIGFWAT